MGLNRDPNIVQHLTKMVSASTLIGPIFPYPYCSLDENSEIALFMNENNIHLTPISDIS
jgi:hypothetical protein